jgi:hypothetical protein
MRLASPISPTRVSAWPDITTKSLSAACEKDMNAALLATSSTSRACDTLKSRPQIRVPRYRGMVTRWHEPLHDLVTASPAWCGLNDLAEAFLGDGAIGDLQDRPGHDNGKLV